MRFATSTRRSSSAKKDRTALSFIALSNNGEDVSLLPFLRFRSAPMLMLMLDALVCFLRFLCLSEPRFVEAPTLMLTLDALPLVCFLCFLCLVPGATSMSTRSALDPHRSAQHSAQQERSTASEKAAIANVTCHGTQKLKVCVCLFWFV